ncbi:MAG: cold shock domain-containing protein [Pseudomonadota bacterium]
MLMREEDGARQTPRFVSGTVKWFDPTKGFGFIVGDGGGKDILLHANVLRNFGQSSVADGVRIEVHVQDTARGIQATEVLSIERPPLTSTPSLSDISALSAEDIDQLEVQPARVKWFDKGKGFGFANVFGSDEDVFVHIEVLRNSGLADLQPGEAICVRVMSGKRGLMAAALQSWESVLLR